MKGYAVFLKSPVLLEPSPFDGLISYPGTHIWRVLPLGKDAVGVFCNPSLLGFRTIDLISLFNTISNLVGYLVQNPSL